MSFKATKMTLAIAAFAFLGVAGTAAVASAAVAGSAIVVHTAAVYADTCVATPTTVCPGDGGAGNG